MQLPKILCTDQKTSMGYRYAVFTTEISLKVRKAISVHKNYRLARRSFEKYFQAIPEWAFGIAVCPIGKRVGDLLTFAEIVEASDLVGL